MINKYNNKKESEPKLEIRETDESKVDEIILEAENSAEDKKIHSAKDSNYFESIESIKKAGEKISLILVFALLVLSIIQSVELFNLRNQIAKGRFTTGTPASAAGSVQSLPSQQGGC